VTYWITQLEVRHAKRLRPISTIVSITPEVRLQMHAYLSKIREHILVLNIPEKKKEALLYKLNSLSDEIDRERTKAEAYTAFALEIASATGQVAKELNPVKDLADSFVKLLGKAKEMAEGVRRLPAPTLPKRIEGPNKGAQSSENLETNFSSDVNDDIPF
jgi:hypothetical protein